MDRSRRYRNPQVERQLCDMIKERGFAVTAMLPTPPLEPFGWTYTVGMTARGLPELVIPDMPGDRAADYLHQLGGQLMAARARLRPGDVVRMPDATAWGVREQHPRATSYGVHWAMRLYGERHKVTALRLLPPLPLATLPGRLWQGYRCQCGCDGEREDPLRAVRHHVGTVYGR